MAGNGNETSDARKLGGGVGDWTDVYHTGPGTLAGRYVRMFWQPVYCAGDLQPGRAVPIKIMGEDFTLYRGQSGAPHLLDFRCAHRGAQLSIGRVEGDNLRCLYHGWMYDKNGQCVDQPAESKPFCDEIRIRNYPTYDYLGLIFAYLGEGEPPRFPAYRDFEGDNILLVVTPPLQLPCNFFRQIDNNGDMHISFLHVGTLESRGAANLYEQTAEETDWGLTWTDARPGWETRKTHFLMPNGNQDKRVPLKRSAKYWTETLQWAVPVDDEHHLRFEVYREYATAEEKRQILDDAEVWFKMRAHVCELGEAVLQGKLRLDEIKDPTRNMVQIQDYLAMVGQGAISDRVPEHLGRSDKVLVMRKKIWERELLALAQGKPLKEWKRPDRLEAGNERVSL